MRGHIATITAYLLAGRAVQRGRAAHGGAYDRSDRAVARVERKFACYPSIANSSPAAFGVGTLI